MVRPIISLSLSLAPAFAQAQVPLEYVSFEPPPPAMAPQENPDAAPSSYPRTTLWSTGDPTDQEQLYLELINRARSNPAAEGARLAVLADADVQQSYSFFSVNLAMMQTEMAALPVAAPLAMNAKLLLAARNHSNDQFTGGFQGHVGSDGASLGTRLTRVGYSASYYAENVYAYSKSTEFGHAGFEVDWGYESGGMQAGRGHRAAIHAGFREVGIGIRNGYNGSVGPQVVTQDFGVPAGAELPFLLGVAFYDFDGDNFYDPGEGIGGVTVTAQGSSYHAVTAASGGYALPVPAGAATRTVTFTGTGLNHSTTAAFGASNTNRKVDFKPAYAAPVVNGAATVPPGTASPYQLTATGGASSYEWRSMPRTPAAFDGANSNSRVNFTAFALMSTAVKQEGTGAYQLVQYTGSNETVTYKATLRGGTAPSISYQSRLRSATTGQRARVQISTDSGTTWGTVDTQNGIGSPGQASFSLRNVPLPAAAGKDFLLRFAFDVASGSYFNGTGSSFGWFVDAVTFTDVLDTTGAVTGSIPGGGRDFTFVPSTPGSWLLSGRASVSGRSLAFGPVLEVAATTAPPAFASWAAGHESSAGLAAGTIANAPAADHNRDGVANLMAYALDLSPVAPAAALLPPAVAAQGILRLDYPSRTDRPDVTLTPQVSSDGVNWFTPGQSGAPAGFSDTVLTTAGNVQTRRAAVPVSGGRRYLRLKATKL